MKNSGFLCLFLLGLLTTVKAQITITNAVFPTVGDTLSFFVDTQPSGIVALTLPGGNQNWDFSSLQPSVTWQQIFRDASTGSVFGDFPSANLVYQTGTPDVEAYLDVSTQNVSFLGYSGGSADAFGLDLVAKYNPPIVTTRAPVNFFDINQISSGLLLPFDASILPNVDQLPVTPDSLRIRVAINRLDVVDAWGTLSIPNGSFNVLREKRTQYTERRLDGKVPPLGWLDITDVAIQVLGLTSLGVDTTVSYYFLNDMSKEPIAICTMDNAQSMVLSVQYKNVEIPTGIKTEERTVADLSVFPNPAKDVLQLRASSLDEADYTLQIYSMLGQEVLQETCTATSGQLEETVDIGRLEKGVYICKISNGNGQSGQMLFVKQ